MAVTAQGSGTQTATLTTEHTLLDVAVAGSFVLAVRLNNMAAGDVTEFRVKGKMLTGQASPDVMYFDMRKDAQPTDDQWIVFVPVSNELTDAASLRFTLKQTLGTGRAYDWKVLKIG